MRFYKVLYSVKNFDAKHKWVAIVEADDKEQAASMFKKTHPNYSGFTVYNPDHYFPENQKL
jgi:hypothetical protein